MVKHLRADSPTCSQWDPTNLARTWPRRGIASWGSIVVTVAENSPERGWRSYDGGMYGIVIQLDYYILNKLWPLAKLVASRTLADSGIYGGCPARWGRE